ncbi:hypothetical protein H0H87_007489 [Tephrocybe sp. NHM501043]|nr:hypothetical protein H0H87_007489 [Tephrocybe sp. NHM501043]
MTVFYPDGCSENQARADRLQQLINNIGVIQTDITNEKKRMDELDEECRIKLDELLKAGDIETLQELKDKAMSKLTDAEKTEFDQVSQPRLVNLCASKRLMRPASRQLINATKAVAQVTETMLWAGLLLGGNKLVNLSGKTVMAIVRGIAEIQAIRVAVAAFVETIGNLVKGGASAGRALANVAKKASEIVDGLANTESRVARVFRFLGKIGKWLSWCGVVLVAAAPLIEIFVGGKQKENLIEGIHETQVTRLVVSALKHQARNITEQMSSTNMFLSLLKKGKKATADSIAEEMIESIKAEDDKISLIRLEESLREADRSTLRFYGADDLEKDIVVQRAELERAEDTKDFKANLEIQKA